LKTATITTASLDYYGVKQIRDSMIVNLLKQYSKQAYIHKKSIPCGMLFYMHLNI
jgi:hypothetical protein